MFECYVILYITKTIDIYSILTDMFECYVILYITKTKEIVDMYPYMFECYVILYITKTVEGEVKLELRLSVMLFYI